MVDDASYREFSEGGSVDPPLTTQDIMKLSLCDAGFTTCISDEKGLLVHL
jgi:hypothetical protein